MFPPKEPRELQTLIDKAIRLAVMTAFPTLAIRPKVVTVETQNLTPKGWNLSVKIDYEVTPLEKKEEPPK